MKGLTTLMTPQFVPLGTRASIVAPPRLLSMTGSKESGPGCVASRGHQDKDIYPIYPELGCWLREPRLPSPACRQRWDTSLPYALGRFNHSLASQMAHGGRPLRLKPSKEGKMQGPKKQLGDGSLGKGESQVQGGYNGGGCSQGVEELRSPR